MYLREFDQKLKTSAVSTLDKYPISGDANETVSKSDEFKYRKITEVLHQSFSIYMKKLLEERDTNVTWPAQFFLHVLIFYNLCAVANQTKFVRGDAEINNFL